MIPVSSGHALRSVVIERKTLSVNVNITTLCGKSGTIKSLSFQFFYPELGDAVDSVVECSACQQIYARTKVNP